MDIKKVLKELSMADGLGGIKNALIVAENELKKFAKVRFSGNSLIGVMDSHKSTTVMLDAHIDQIGMMVTSIKDGFLKVSAAGGIDARMLPAMRVNIYGKKTIKGVFCSVPPHLAKKDDSAPSLDNLYIDTGFDSLEGIVSVGDRVAFDMSFTELSGDLVTGKSLDNRAGVASLILAAERLSKKELPCNVIILFSDMEEIGGDGAKTETFSLSPQRAIVVDVSFGNAPEIPPEKTGVLGNGGMIGISPALSKEITDNLQKAAEKANIPYQLEVMGGKSSTNADHIAVTKSGVPTGLVSIPLRNMHTPVEVVSIKDIESVADILCEYILNCTE